MAELLLKIGTVGPDPAYQDGDIVVAPNDRRISQVHLEHHCHVMKFGFNYDGRRPEGTLAQRWREAVCQYKFERISWNLVRRTNLFAGGSVELGPTPNADGEYINVAQFIARRLSHPRHAIFGTPGFEFWYGGTQDLSAAKLDLMWPEVEAQLRIRKSNFTLFPFSDHEKRNFLALKVDDFDDAAAGLLAAPMLEAVTDRILKKRERKVAWRGLDIGVTVQQVESRTAPIDIRGTRAFTRQAIVTAKARV